MAKKYLVIQDRQIEEGVDVGEHSSRWSSTLADADAHYAYWYKSVADGKAGAVTLYSVDWDRDTGIMGLPVVLKHKSNKFKKIVRYNMETKSAVKKAFNIELEF